MKKKYFVGSQSGLSFAGGRPTSKKAPLLAFLGLLLAAGLGYLLLQTNKTASFTTLTLIYAGATLIIGSIGGYFGLRTFKAKQLKFLMLLISILSFGLACLGLLYFISFFSKNF
ncbi:hypothetical protein [Isobaculum melis]|uniref:Uncharacterized protein n=1 Tax=Isobaculum melis TaxID=142588 RepID=A0A1H9R8Z8_9LACT|nr:hypothetical protein [Isobaculum melis]SER69371.1 hypothetical protein SAMN04488559_103143 [Isobaculum melis]